MTSTHYPTDLTNAQWENLLPYLPESPRQLGDALNYQRVLHSQVSGLTSDATWQTAESGIHGL